MPQRKFLGKLAPVGEAEAGDRPAREGGFAAEALAATRAPPAATRDSERKERRFTGRIS